MREWEDVRGSELPVSLEVADMALNVRVLDSSSAALRKARVDLAAVHRIANRFGFDDGIWNHFTLMVPGTTDRFLVKAHGLLMNEITASNLIVGDSEGNVLEGEGRIERSAFCIHSRIHRDHPHAQCILHAHPPYATWLSDVAQGRLMMTNQDNLRFYGRVAYDDDYAGPAFETSEGERMASAFEGKPILISRNHGLTVAADSVAEAFYDMYYVELACKRQHLLVSSGAPLSIVSDNVAANAQGELEVEREESAVLFFDALKRQLDRHEPEYVQ